jgi:hypothetical protein
MSSGIAFEAFFQVIALSFCRLYTSMRLRLHKRQ